MDSKIAFRPMQFASFLSARTVYLPTNVTDQYYSDYKQTINGNQNTCSTKILCKVDLLTVFVLSLLVSLIRKLNNFQKWIKCSQTVWLIRIVIILLLNLRVKQKQVFLLLPGSALIYFFLFPHWLLLLLEWGSCMVSLFSRCLSGLLPVTTIL